MLGFLLRLINLKQQPFWGDEVLSLDIVMQYHNIHQMLHYLADVEVHPPLYYLMLHFWTGWFGTGTVGVKSLSLIFGLGCIPAAYFFAKSLFKNQRVALLTALLVAVLPFQLQFSQEARPYIIFCFFAIVAAWALWQYFSTRKFFYYFIYLVANIIGIYLHYSYSYILIAMALWGLVEILLSDQRKSREFIYWLCVHALILLAFSFWLVPFLMKIDLGRYVIFGWPRLLPKTRGYDVNFLLNQLIWLTKLKQLPRTQILATFLSQLVIFGSFIWYLIANKNQDNKNVKPLVYLLWLSLLPIPMFVFSPQSLPYTVIFERHIIFVSIFLALLLAWLLSVLPKRVTLAVLMLFLISLIPYDSTVLGNDAQWDYDYNLQSGGEFINQQYKPGDLVLVDVGIIRTDLGHYLREDIPIMELAPSNYFGNDFWNTRHTLGFIENEYQSRMQAPTRQETEFKLNEIEKLYHPKRVWLYDFEKADTVVRDWYVGHGYRPVYQNVDDVFRVDLYAKK